MNLKFNILILRVIIRIIIIIIIIISKKYLNVKIDISILYYYFQIWKLVFQFRKLLIDYKNGHFNFEYFYVNMKIYISEIFLFKF